MSHIRKLLLNTRPSLLIAESLIHRYSRSGAISVRSPIPFRICSCPHQSVRCMSMKKLIGKDVNKYERVQVDDENGRELGTFPRFEAENLARRKNATLVLKKDGKFKIFQLEPLITKDMTLEDDENGKKEAEVKTAPGIAQRLFSDGESDGELDSGAIPAFKKKPKFVVKRISMTYRLTPNDFEIKMTKILSWVAKDLQVRVVVTGEEGKEQQLEKIFERIKSKLAGQAKVVQKSISHNSLKFGVIPLKDKKLHDSDNEAQESPEMQTATSTDATSGPQQHKKSKDLDPDELLDETLKKEMEQLLNPKK